MDVYAYIHIFPRGHPLTPENTKRKEEDKFLRKRKNQLLTYLNDEELEQLNKQVTLSGLTRSSFVRLRLSGKMPQPVPPKEFHKMWQAISELKQEVQALHIELLQNGQTETAAMVDELSTKILSQMRLIYERVYSNISSD